MAGPAPTCFQFTKTFDAGPVHCSVWLCTGRDAANSTARRASLVRGDRLSTGAGYRPAGSAPADRAECGPCAPSPSANPSTSSGQALRRADPLGILGAGTARDQDDQVPQPVRRGVIVSGHPSGLARTPDVVMVRNDPGSRDNTVGHTDRTWATRSVSCASATRISTTPGQGIP